ncbi:copper resistance protein D [Klebsiella pneumoniae subsp. pneumoniae]|uniref:Copper resistance protein D n=1 Tax=Klebsiella pneumoniae subsp. pneumoniae TaxID=72407 RepID=A0A377ZHF0_KLEPN|nr:copper resistance protein D [Klebsiella pneumoniae subsp. pneumoniae]
MLTGLYITLRFGHFISLMLAFGCVLYGAWWAPVPLRRVLMLRFIHYCARCC